MNRRNFYMVVALVIVAIFIVIAVFAVQNSWNEKPIRVEMLLKSRDANFEFWQQVKSGAQTAAKEYGVELNVTGPRTEEDVDEQIQLMLRAMGTKPDVILLAAVDQVRLRPYVIESEQKGIRVILVDSSVGADAGECFVGTDNIRAAQSLGDRLAEAIGGSGEIAVISHQKQTATAVDRLQGFYSALERYPEIKVVEEVDIGDSSQKSYEEVRRIVMQYPNLKGIYATNQISAEGVTRALKEMRNQLESIPQIAASQVLEEGVKAQMLSNMEEFKRQYAHAEEIVFWGFDFSKIQNDSLEKGIVDGFVVQRPFNMGYLSVVAATDLVNRKPVEPFVDTGFTFVTQANMRDEEIQKLIYPFY